MKKGLSQEGLKLLACGSMLLDHVGATLVWSWYLSSPGMGLYYFYMALRCIGRIAFPIYCFMLSEGACYTRDPKKYALRLVVGLVLSELPFDLAFSGGWSWAYQNVMVTLLLGFLALRLMMKTGNIWLKLLICVPFALLAEWMNTDYGGWGVAMIAMFGILRNSSGAVWQRVICLLSICQLMDSAWISVFGLKVSVELLAGLALIPISLYSGTKKTNSKALQWAFYLFYPVHLTVLWALEVLIFG